jgi:hypothetical protein
MADKTDDEIKKDDAEAADAWFWQRVTEYYTTGCDPRGWVSQRPGGARMIGWGSVPQVVDWRCW